MVSEISPVNWLIPFVAGGVSFLSPCVMPLIPGYLSYVSGVSADQLVGGGKGQVTRVLGYSLLFVLGFSLVFVALGASASAIGAVLTQYRFTLNRIAGLFMIFMGLYLMGFLRVGTLSREYRVQLMERPQGPFGSIILGAAFAFAWTPCIGPVLASVLIYAASVSTVKTGALMLFAYSLGLGLPFILMGLAFARALHALQWVRRFSRTIELVSGGALATVGILLLANKMFYVSIWAQRIFIRFGLDLWRFF